MSDVLVCRPAVDDDHNYIYETWLADLRESDPSFLPNDIWFPAHREVIRRVLERAQVTVLVDAEEPETIFGYIVTCPDYIHWIHIRRGKVWRNRGLAKRLLQETNSKEKPLVWRTRLGQEKLHSPLRSRQARHAWWSTTDR